MRLLLLVGLSVSFVCTKSFAQDTPFLNKKISVEKYVNSVSGKSAEIANKIDKQTEKYLNKLEKQERRIYKKLSKIDSFAAKKIFTSSQNPYEQIREEIKNHSAKLLGTNGRYLPWIDTAATSLKFLESSNLNGKLPLSPAELKSALEKVHGLEDKLKQAENIKEFIRQRKEYLTKHLKDFDLGKDLQKFNKQAYYYSQQINEYKAILNDPEKIEAKAISLLRKIPAFEKFMQQNGMLAGLFNVPRDYATSSLTGLQTINQVATMLENRMSSLGPSGPQNAQQNIGSAQAALSQVRNRFSQGGNTEEMPDFKPNTQKTKTFFQRLEFGSNLQSTKSNTMFPMTTDIGLSVGYKLNDKSVLGIGGSYKLGLGKNWNHISVSHQGIGFRTFADFKLKGTFWLSGGGELNYHAPFNDLSVFHNYSIWSKSALLGATKKYNIGKKFSGNAQLLFDFLYNKQIPHTQPIVFRLGYGIK